MAFHMLDPFLMWARLDLLDFRSWAGHWEAMAVAGAADGEVAGLESHRASSLTAALVPWVDWADSVDIATWVVSAAVPTRVQSVIASYRPVRARHREIIISQLLQIQAALRAATMHLVKPRWLHLRHHQLKNSPKIITMHTALTIIGEPAAAHYQKT